MRFKIRAASFFAFLIAVHPVHADPDFTVTEDVGWTWNLQWDGESNHSYFLLGSDDLENWVYLPIVEVGAGAPINWGFSSDSEQLFFRLQSVNQTDPDPEEADYDADGISNIDEVRDLNFDPLDPDQNNNQVDDGLEDEDGDGLTNGWESQHGLHAGNADENNDGTPDGQNDFDGDGVSNAQEASDGTDPLDRSSVTSPPTQIADTGNATGLLIHTPLD